MRPQSSTDDTSRPAPLDAFRARHRDSCGPCALRWSSGPGDFAPDGLSSEDFHDMARILESLARSMRREADRRWAERKGGGWGTEGEIQARQSQSPQGIDNALQGKGMTSKAL